MSFQKLQQSIDTPPSEPDRTETRLRVLTVLGAATRRLVRADPGGEPRSILVMRPDHLGDLLFATPALRRLKLALPHTHVSVLTGPWGRRILQGNPNVDSTVIWDIPWFSRRASANPVAPYASALGLIREVRRRRFDSTLVLRFDFWWGALVAQLAGIRQRIGYLTAETEPFLTTAVPYERRARHEVERNLTLVDELLRRAGVELAAASGAERMEFHTTTSDEAEADGVLARHGIRKADRLVAIHAGAGSPLKWWSEEGFAEVADRLSALHGCRVVLTGQEAEAGLVRGIERKATCAPIGVVGETSLGGLAALYRRCECVVGSDSGPMHIAVAMGTPTVHLFGPADERLFGPWGDPARQIVLRTRVECAPCGHLDVCLGSYGHRACMTRLTPDLVVEAAGRAMAAGRSDD